MATVITHECALKEIQRRHDLEDSEELHREKWRSDTMKWLKGIGLIVIGDAVVKLIFWLFALAHIGNGSPI